MSTSGSIYAAADLHAQSAANRKAREERAAFIKAAIVRDELTSTLVAERFAVSLRRARVLVTEARRGEL